tara:strand:- start:119 stop:271 length:153 start_codon:yes stop_codon:yes gene_type:complete
MVIALEEVVLVLLVKMQRQVDRKPVRVAMVQHPQLLAQVLPVQVVVEELV